MVVPLITLKTNIKDVNLGISLPVKIEDNLVSIYARKVYTDLTDKSILSAIKLDLTSVSGIYAFRHNESNKLYVGSSFNLALRISDHLKNRSSNILLQRALAKHGLNNFSLFVLEIKDKPVVTSNLTVEGALDSLKNFMSELIVLEQKYLDFFIKKYNINPAAGTRLGAKHTDETKALIRRVFKENPHFLNKTFSEEVLEKMRIRMSGSLNPMYGKPVTEANKKLISDLFRKDVYLYDANTLNLINKFSKHGDMVKETGISYSSITKYKDSGLVFKKRYIISSKNPEEMYTNIDTLNSSV